MVALARKQSAVSHRVTKIAPPAGRSSKSRG